MGRIKNMSEKNLYDDIQELEEFVKKVAEFSGASTSSEKYSKIKYVIDFAKYSYNNLPLKEGDRATLIEPLVIEKSSGWYGSKHYLIPGWPGTINRIYFYEKPLCYFEPDNQTWIDDENIQRPKSRPHVYTFDLNKLRKI